MARRTRRRNLETPRPINMRDLGEAISHPGIDPRTWVSYALVDSELPVDFSEEDYGPLVNVVLQPSDVPARCRVSGLIAGDGEAEYHPFMGGDEVIVLLPHGRPDADCVIVGRLNNARAKFPTSVAGQDATKNAFGFSRKRTARLEEAAGPWMVRQATSGALMTMDDSGTITIRDGAGDALQISPDVMSLIDSGATFFLQIDISGERATLQANDARFVLAGTGASPGVSSLAVPGLLTIMSSKNVAAEHAVSTEAVANMLAQWGLAIAALAGSTYTSAISLINTPMAGSPLTPIAAPFAGAMVAAFGAGTTLATAMTAAAASPLLPNVAAAIQGAFAAQPQKNSATVVPGTGQAFPGIGSQGTLIG
jgi:hypothetical protein